LKNIKIICDVSIDISNKIARFRHNTIFKDVYREVGMLEVFVTCLHRYATLLKDKQAAIDQGLGKDMIIHKFVK